MGLRATGRVTGTVEKRDLVDESDFTATSATAGALNESGVSPVAAGAGGAGAGRDVL